MIRWHWLLMLTIVVAARSGGTSGSDGDSSGPEGSPLVAVPTGDDGITPVLTLERGTTPDGTVIAIKATTIVPEPNADLEILALFELEPDGTELDEPIPFVISRSFDADEIPVIVVASTSDGLTWDLLQGVTTEITESGDMTISGEIGHFSLLAAFGINTHKSGLAPGHTFQWVGHTWNAYPILAGNRLDNDGIFSLDHGWGAGPVEYLGPLSPKGQAGGIIAGKFRCEWGQAENDTKDYMYGLVLSYQMSALLDDLIFNGDTLAKLGSRSGMMKRLFDIAEDDDILFRLDSTREQFGRPIEMWLKLEASAECFDDAPGGSGSSTDTEDDGQDPRAQIVGIEPTATADTAQAFIVRFSQPWTTPPADLFSYFFSLAISVGDCSTTAGWQTHAGIATPLGPGPTFLLGDGSVLIDTGCEVNPGAPITIAGQSGSQDESTSEPVFRDWLFTVTEEERAASTEPFDEDVVCDLGSETQIPCSESP